MDIESLRAAVLRFEDVEEGFPFGNETLVFKIAGKIFLLVSLDSQPVQFNVKCDPDHAVELREEYPDSVLPGYHMNKKHWNTVIVDGRLSNRLLLEMIKDSYELVKPKMKKRKGSA